MTALRLLPTPERLKQLRATVLVSPRTVGTMPGMVAGGIPAYFVLKMGERTDGHAGGRASAAVIVAGVISEAGGRRKDDRFAALILPLTTASVLQEIWDENRASSGEKIAAR